MDTKGPAYRGYLFALATVPMVSLFVEFAAVQKAYAVFGALFMPMVAVALLVLNGRTAWVGRQMRNRRLTGVVLAATLLLFLVFGFLELRKKLGL